MSTKPVCLGSGLVALDVIYDDIDSKPKFLAGGSCGNVLTILSYLNWNSFPLARLGKDPEGNRIIEDMRRWGVKTKFVEQNSEIHSPRIIERVSSGRKPRHKFYLKCTHGNWLPGRRPYLLKSLELIQHNLPKSNVFYFDRASPSALETARILKKQGAMIIFEPPKFLHDKVFLQCLKIADIVKHCYDQSDETVGFGVKIPLEIQTKGENGLQYKARFLRHRDWQQMEAFPVFNLIDAAGSGDWLTAGLIHVLGQNGSKHIPTEKKLEFSLKFGQALASLNCNFVGARGIMYNLRKSQLFSLVEKMITVKAYPEIKLSSKSRIKSTSSISSKCKVCLCSN